MTASGVEQVTYPEVCSWSENDCYEYLRDWGILDCRMTYCEQKYQ